MKLAYADRAAYLGDSDRVDVPQEWLVSKQHAAELRKLIDPAHAQAARALRPDIPVPAAPVPGSGNTTHFSVVDAAGNAVANTYTLNFNYGLGLVAAGTGIMLNNELDDFAAKPGVPNAFGLVGGAANAPGPDKRPLSSMTPTIVLKDGKPVLVTGAPGGSRIITTVLQVVVNALDGGKADRRCGGGSAPASPVVSRRGRGGARLPGGQDRGAHRARPHRQAGAAVRLGAFDRGDPAGPRRRRRSARAGRFRGGELKAARSP